MAVTFARGFRGGTHPPEHKDLTSKRPIETAALPERVVIPLQQHIGAPCEPAVSKGDRVKVGQVVGLSKTFVSAPVHAGISGEVLDVEEHPHPIGTNVLSVIIEGDGSDEWREESGPRTGWENLSREELLVIIHEAGLVGLGGAAFPTHIKLSPPKEKPIDTAVLNGAECEPYLTADHRLMLEKPETILTGFQIIMKILGVKRGVVGIEHNKMDALGVMSRIASHFPGVEVSALRAKYPQGAEKQLIRALLGREVPPPPGLPMDVGAVVQNVGTAYAIAEAVTETKPLIERVCTVTGSAVRKPKNLLIRIGTLFSHLFNECGGLTEDVGKIIMGGPMMGVAQAEVDIPAVKGTSGIMALTREEAAPVEQVPCLRCGKCLSVCPMRLVPTDIAVFAENGMFDTAERLHCLDCIECGCCSYICPSGRHLVQLIRYGKTEIMAAKRKA